MAPARARSAVRILLVEDHALFAESLDLALTMEGYDVRRVPVAEYGMSQVALLSAITRLHPRIVLLDLDLGDMGDGVRLIGPLAKAGAMVVVVTASTDEGRWGQCVRFGARKVLSKGGPLNEIMSTVRRLNQGLPVMDVTERERLLAAWHHERREQEVLLLRLERLTGREKQVLGHLMSGDSVRDISRMSVVSEATVRTQVKSILAKLEVSSQLAAVGLAHKVGWRRPIA